MNAFANDMFFTLLGGLTLLAMLFPHGKHLEDKSYRAGHYNGYQVGMSAGLRYADQLIDEGWECSTAAYVGKDGERIGVVCTNGVLIKILSKVAEGV